MLGCVPPRLFVRSAITSYMHVCWRPLPSPNTTFIPCAMPSLASPGSRAAGAGAVRPGLHACGQAQGQLLGATCARAGSGGRELPGTLRGSLASRSRFGCHVCFLLGLATRLALLAQPLLCCCCCCHRALPAQLSEIEAQPREQAAVPGAGAEQSYRPVSPPAADLVCPPAPFTVFPCLHASCCSWRPAIPPTHLPTCSPTHSPTQACLLLYCTLPQHTASQVAPHFRTQFAFTIVRCRIWTA